MPELDDPYRRDDLIAALESVHREAAELFGSLSEDDFFRRPEDGVWSPAENLVHLIKSVQAVASAMGWPRLLLTVLFGRSHGGSRSYAEIRAIYLEALGQGGRAGGRYVPAALAPAGAEAIQAARARALAGWDRVGKALVGILGRWSEENLDRHRLPHPLLGKLTVREMLLFTHYHDLHHLQSVRKRHDQVGGAR